MWKKAFKNANLTKSINDIVDFVDESGNAPDFSSSRDKFISSFIAKLKKDSNKIESIKLDLDSFSFFDLSNYNRSEINDYELFTFMMLSSQIKGKIIEGLSEEYRVKKERFKEYGKLERQISPPLSAYDYVGNNKTNITYSNKSYGLLFE
jgi:hypothetical protein